MRRSCLCFIAFCILGSYFTTINAKDQPLKKRNSVEKEYAALTYPVNPFVKADIWAKLQPYYLPESHPAKQILDKIFSQSRVLLNLKTLKKAGFVEATPRKFTHLIVTTHPQLPGIVVKLYLDPQRYYKNLPEYEHWLKRIKGAQAIRDKISAQGWESLFKVPNKWIYPLPAQPSPPKDFLRKNFILVEEDMQLIDHKSNLNQWKSSQVSPELLIALHTLLKSLGLSDCVKPDNIPFSTDGKVAFIDTQSHHQWPVPYKNLNPYLSSSNQRLWKQITKG